LLRLQIISDFVLILLNFLLEKKYYNQIRDYKIK